MRRAAVALFVLGFALARAGTSGQAADEALAAFRSGDGEALQALAAQNVPDPWLVAEELCHRGEHAAAAAFAKAAPRKAVERLPDYVAGRRGAEPDREGHEALRRADAAMRSGDHAAALEAARGIGLSPASVARVRVAFFRGLALARLGRPEESGAALREAGEAARGLGWLGQVDGAFHEIALQAYARADWQGALEAWQVSLEMTEAVGDDMAGVAGTLFNLGLVYQRMSRHEEALAAFRRSLGTAEGLSDEATVAQALTEIGNSHLSRGEYEEALAAYRPALDKNRALGNERASAGITNNIGAIHENRGEYADALAAYRESLDMATSMDDRLGIAYALGNIGNVHARMGEDREALEYHRRALGLAVALDHKPLVARQLVNLGVSHHALYEYALALSAYERALAVCEALGYMPAIGRTHMNVGSVHASVGDYGKALEAHGRALEIGRAIGDQPLVAQATNNIGHAHASLGQHAEAMVAFRSSLEAKEALGDRRGAAITRGNLASLHFRLGDYPQALSAAGDALAGMEDVGDKAGMAAMLSKIAAARVAMQEHDGAFEAYGRALGLLDAAPAPGVRAAVLEGLAKLCLLRGESGVSVGHAREAAGIVQRFGRGLGDEQGAMVADRWADVFETGMRAALEANDPAAMAFFLESGRAVLLRESLGAREALRSVLLPETLARDEAAAREREARATEALRRATRAGVLEEMAGASAELAAAQRGLEEVIARIQRTAKAGASIAYPEADGIADMQRRLGEGDALVLYGLTGAEGVALVLRPRSARIVRLAAGEDLVAAAAALGAGDPGTSPDPAPLRRLLVEPLGLDDGVRRVLVSPAGRLGYLPFALLLPGKDVAYVPSGTAHGLLFGETGRHGETVLAVGDPDYGTVARSGTISILRAGAERLVPLPGTRREAEAIGDVRLLGRDASEAGVAEAIGKRDRWRAVHFACHGLVDPDRPMLSSLALSATGEDDGFLTCLEVLRMRIPADLVVLSACETGTGRIYKAEGIFGLTRAFMHAGSPRVICSLWKVDDEATRALMVRLYELWKPGGISTAAALRKAQEFVASHEKWRHPCHWAAWQLWGLPD